MNEYPILTNIAIHCDFNTLMNFMLINRKAYAAVKHVIRNAPTRFMIMYDIETNGKLPKKFIFESLKELFTEIHQYYLNHPKIYPGNYDGPCNDCLSDPEMVPIRTFDCCHCDDVMYLGIKMIKHISPSRDDKVFELLHPNHEWDNRLTSVSNGNRMSMILNNLYCNCFKCLRGKEINYKSMDYLFFGHKKYSFFRKNGIRKWNPDKMKNFDRYYPATTDIIQFLTFGYVHENKLDFKTQHSILFIEPEKQCKVRINTI